MNTNKTDDAMAEAAVSNNDRRVALRRLGRFAAVTAPTVGLLLAAGTKPSLAEPASLKNNPVPGPVSSRQFKERCTTLA